MAKVSFVSWLHFNPDDFRDVDVGDGDIVEAVNEAFRNRVTSLPVPAAIYGGDTVGTVGGGMAGGGLGGGTMDMPFGLSGGGHVAPAAAAGAPGLASSASVSGSIPMAEELPSAPLSMEAAADVTEEDEDDDEPISSPGQGGPAGRKERPPSLAHLKRNTMLVEHGLNRMMSFRSDVISSPADGGAAKGPAGGVAAGLTPTSPFPPMSPADPNLKEEGVYEDPSGDADYDPVYYSCDPRTKSYDVSLDLSKSRGLGLVLAPLIEGYPLATVIKRFSTSKDGSQGAAESAGIHMFDILTHINGINITKFDHDKTVDAMRKALKNKDRPLRLRLFDRSTVMTERCDRMWAFFGKPRLEGEVAKAPAKIKGIAWVDRYIIQNEVLHVGVDDRKSVLRKYMMLWHPDRFMARFGKKILSDEYREGIFKKAQWVSQEVSLAKVEIEDVEEAAAERVRKGVDHAQTTGGSAVNTEGQTAKEAPRRVIHDGYLYKRALKSGRNWRRRYFTLDNRATITYMTKPKAPPKGTLELTDESRVEIKTDIGKKFAFEIKTRDHVLYCAAKNDQERNAWINNLNSTISWCTEGKPRTAEEAEAAEKKKAEAEVEAAQNRAKRAARGR